MAREKRTFVIATGKNGRKFVTLESVEAIFHAVNGNSKTGDRVGNYNLPIELTCDHRCECYKDALCYAENGCYLYSNNQADYSENLRFFQSVDDDTFIAVLESWIINHKKELFRYFTCGDIPNERFFRLMVRIARDLPNVKFWSYTKKYNIVNHYCDINGVESIPENLVIIFSHWLNRDGSYFPMNNPYTFPTSEFIPIGREDLIETVTHICPCSDPSVPITHCQDCEHACYNLRHGESMALLEHSTSETKKRDKATKAAKAAVK